MDPVGSYIRQVNIIGCHTGSPLDCPRVIMRTSRIRLLYFTISIPVSRFPNLPKSLNARFSSQSGTGHMPICGQDFAQTAQTWSFDSHDEICLYPTQPRSSLYLIRNRRYERKRLARANRLL
eukprot:sb/3476029/